MPAPADLAGDRRTVLDELPCLVGVLLPDLRDRLSGGWRETARSRVRDVLAELVALGWAECCDDRWAGGRVYRRTAAGLAALAALADDRACLVHGPAWPGRKAPWPSQAPAGGGDPGQGWPEATA